jgi:hypothetical protein
VTAPSVVPGPYPGFPNETSRRPDLRLLGHPNRANDTLCSMVACELRRSCPRTRPSLC